MNWTGKVVLGIILLILGGNILLNTLGIHLGGIIGLALAVVLMFYGYSKMKNSDRASTRLFGMGILIFGGLIALGQAHMFIGLFIAVVIIYFGYQMIKKDKNPNNMQEDTLNEQSSSRKSEMKMEDAFDMEWNQFLQKNNMTK